MLRKSVKSLKFQIQNLCLAKVNNQATFCQPWTFWTEPRLLTALRTPGTDWSTSGTCCGCFRGCRWIRMKISNWKRGGKEKHNSTPDCLWQHLLKCIHIWPGCYLRIGLRDTGCHHSGRLINLVFHWPIPPGDGHILFYTSCHVRTQIKTWLDTFSTSQPGNSSQLAAINFTHQADNAPNPTAAHRAQPAAAS